MTTTSNHSRDTRSPADGNEFGTTGHETKLNPRTQIPSGYVPLPAVPKTKSPVPWLSSIHATPGRGAYGSASYRGNCSGILVRDLLQYHQPKRVLDPMAGGGTCADVCRELGI